FFYAYVVQRVVPLAPRVRGARRRVQWCCLARTAVAWRIGIRESRIPQRGNTTEPATRTQQPNPVDETPGPTPVRNSAAYGSPSPSTRYRQWSPGTTHRRSHPTRTSPSTGTRPG